VSQRCATPRHAPVLCHHAIAIGSERCGLASPGHPWHHEPRVVPRGGRRRRSDALLRVGGRLLPAVLTWWLRVPLRETERGRQQAVRMQIEVLALRAGDTVVGVIGRRHEPAIFLVHETTDGRPTVSLDVMSLVASSCGAYRGQIKQHAAQEFAGHVATQKGRAKRRQHRHPPRA
jgi:hypothetical protein